MMAKVTLLDRHQIAGSYESFGPGIDPKFVTHAEYKALEETNTKLEADFWRVTKQNAELIAQLAAISTRENALADEVIHIAGQLNELRTKYNLPKD